MAPAGGGGGAAGSGANENGLPAASRSWEAWPNRRGRAEASRCCGHWAGRRGDARRCDGGKAGVVFILAAPVFFPMPVIYFGMAVCCLPLV